MTYTEGMRDIGRGPRCRSRLGPGRFVVRARVERFTEPALLLLLAESPGHGYELAERLEPLVGGGRVDFGNLYRLLRALEADGVVASRWDEGAPGPLKRTYELTRQGRALLEAWAASLAERRARLDEFLRRHDRLAPWAENDGEGGGDGGDGGNRDPQPEGGSER